MRGARFPLVTIHRERTRPNECQIGLLRAVRDVAVVLQQIRPGGIWEDEATSYPLREITRVDFGGSYEEALTIFGDKPPPLRPDDRAEPLRRGPASRAKMAAPSRARRGS